MLPSFNVTPPDDPLPPIVAAPVVFTVVASISPDALNITLSPPLTSNIIWLSVQNLI